MNCCYSPASSAGSACMALFFGSSDLTWEAEQHSARRMAYTVAVRHSTSFVVYIVSPRSTVRLKRSVLCPLMFVFYVVHLGPWLNIRAYADDVFLIFFALWEHGFD